MIDFIKKVIFIFFIFFCCSYVRAEQFKIGEYISGEYVKMVGKDTSKYLTIQIIKDSNSNFVYCIEPFELVDESFSDYIAYESDLTGYKSLSEEQKRRISLLAYYGYGYGNRMTQKWYAITQMLIWETVDPESDFYFTDKSNGTKIEKYGGSINELINDVNNHDIGPSFIKDYSVGYKEDLVVTNYNYKFSVESSYKYTYSPADATLSVKNVVEDGYFRFQRDNSNYLWNVVIYDSKDSQDIIKPGRVLNKKYTINVKVNSGYITLDIRKDNSVFYNTGDFSDTCYEISKNDEVIDKVCTSSDNLIYKTDKLAYGEYKVKQVSVGKGYEVDNNIYSVTVDGNSDATLVLNNKLIKNKIELVKFYCIDDSCLYEENAMFNVYDGEILVGSISTDVNGYGFLEVGVGDYMIVQERGLENYTFVDSYTESIVNSSDKYYKELYNYYIEDAVIEPDTIFTDSVINEEVEELPPKTGTKLAEIFKVVYNVVVMIVCCCKLKIFCYNN